MIAWVVALVGASGVVLLASAVPVAKQRLSPRIEPYLERSPAPARRWWPVSLLASEDALRRRVAAAGSDMSPASFRGEQLVWAAVGAALGTVVVWISWLRSGRVTVLPAALLVTLLAVVGWHLRERFLIMEARRRAERVTADLPLVLDLLTLAVTAGHPVQTGIARVAQAMAGPLSDELRRTVGDIHTGATVAEALRSLAVRVPTAPMERVVAALVTALETGSPLADSLRAQADEQRDARRQRILEVAGRREVLMLVPVVFLILPVVIAFALFPGLVTLEMLVP